VGIICNKEDEEIKMKTCPKCGNTHTFSIEYHLGFHFLCPHWTFKEHFDVTCWRCGYSWIKLAIVDNDPDGSIWEENSIDEAISPGYWNEDEK